MTGNKSKKNNYSNTFTNFMVYSNMTNKSTLSISALVAFAAMSLASCSSTYQAGSSNTDDVYYTPRAEADKPADHNGNTQNNSSRNDDYYDPNYSSREGEQPANSNNYSN